MRFARLTTNFPIYLEQFYNQHPSLKYENYAVQYKTLVSDCYGWADFWTHALGKLGYEVWEPISNAEPMQKIWAAEHGVKYNDKTWMFDIAVAQIKYFKPDVLFLNVITDFTVKLTEYLRKELPSIKLVLGWCSTPYRDSSMFKSFDIVLSCHPGMVADFRKKGFQSEYLCHAFDERILEKIDCSSGQSVPFSFIGSAMKGEGFHLQRLQLLKELIGRTDLELWLLSKLLPYKSLMPISIKQKLYDLIRPLKLTLEGKSTLSKSPGRILSSEYLDPAFVPRMHTPLFGVAMFQKLHDSKITLNTHGDIAGPFAANMRLFEATGAGTCLLTDWKSNLHELFEPDKEIVTYRSAEEAAEKAHYLLVHDDRRREIARAGQLRTLKSHNFDLRARQLDELIRKNIK